MPKIKIFNKRYSFKDLFSSLEKDSVALKPGFKTNMKIFSKYLDTNIIFKLPEVQSSKMLFPPRPQHFKNIKSFNLNRIKQITSTKFDKEKVLLERGEKKINLIQNIQLHMNKSNDEKNLVTIAEIKKEYYYFLKFLRFISFYSIAPYNLLLFLHNMNIYSVDWFIFHLFLSNACLFMPYFLTEDWVIKITYDKATNKLHITKLNILCKEYTTIHTTDKIVRIHRKNNLRFFSFFKNKSTNEHFSILHICDIKGENLLKLIIPEKPHVSKRENIHKTHHHPENNSSAYFKHYLKIVLLAYFSVFFGIVLFKLRKLKKENDMIIVE